MLLPELRLPGTEEPSQSPAMLGTLMTALFFVVRAVRQVSPEPLLLPCYSPLPGAALCWGREREAAVSACPAGNGLLCLLNCPG